MATTATAISPVGSTRHTGCVGGGCGCAIDLVRLTHNRPRCYVSRLPQGWVSFPASRTKRSRLSIGCPPLVDIAGGPTGDGLKRQIEAGQFRGLSRLRLIASISATTWKASRRNRHTTSFSTTRGRLHRRYATRTGKCTTRCRSLGLQVG
jgi:hypothetical protein